MDEWQMTVCAIALFADGYSQNQIAYALGVDTGRAQELIDAGGDAQAARQMDKWPNTVSRGAAILLTQDWTRKGILLPNFRGSTAAQGGVTIQNEGVSKWQRNKSERTFLRKYCGQ